MTHHIAVVDASVGERPADRNLTRELDAETTVYKARNGEFLDAGRYGLYFGRSLGRAVKSR